MRCNGEMVGWLVGDGARSPQVVPPLSLVRDCVACVGARPYEWGCGASRLWDLGCSKITRKIGSCNACKQKFWAFHTILQLGSY